MEEKNKNLYSRLISKQKSGNRDNKINAFLNKTSGMGQKLEKNPYKKENQDTAAKPEIEKKVEQLKAVLKQIEKNEIKYKQRDMDFSQYKIDYQNKLNTRQLIAATNVNGPLLVIAGAGSGKTRTLTYRSAFMLENDINAQNVLLLTFTRKAAQEMISRAGGILNGPQAKSINGGTFHSFANHVLRKYAKMLGFMPNFTVLDKPDSEDVVDLIRHEMGFAGSSKPFPKKSRIFEIISKSRNNRVSIENVIENDFPGAVDFTQDIITISMAYSEYKKTHSLFDYEDLMEVLADSMKNNPRFLEILQEKYLYIMVDEYQDTNLAQRDIVFNLAKKYKNVMVVGDDSQSIYSFRGANYENILRFPLDFPECKVVKLEQNYRSTKNVLNFINNISDKAVLSYKKKLFSELDSGIKPVVNRFHEKEQEAVFIADKIIEIRENNVSLDDIAVLYRSSSHSLAVQAELLKMNLPYIVFGGIKFTEKRHIKDVLAYLRVVLNPYDVVAWNRVLKLIPGIGKVLATGIVNTIEKSNGIINFDIYKGKKFYSNLLKLESVLNKVKSSPYSVGESVLVIKKYYQPLLKNVEKRDFEKRLEEIDVLYEIALDYDELEKFLTDFVIDPPGKRFQDKNVPALNDSEDAPIVLSTVHSAKGLEFYAVFAIHLLDGLFPDINCLGDFEQLEEERRLFYVACSRAKNALFLSYPLYSPSYRGHFTLPSRFVYELDKEVYEEASL